MNSIKTRIVKLEKLNGNPDFCNCRDMPKFEVYHADLTTDAETNELQLSGKAVLEVCDQCERPTQKTKIIVQVCDQETKNNFPEQWQIRTEA